MPTQFIFNKTRETEEKVNDRKLLAPLEKQNQLLEKILMCLQKKH